MAEHDDALVHGPVLDWIMDGSTYHSWSIAFNHGEPRPPSIRSHCSAYGEDDVARLERLFGPEVTDAVKSQHARAMVAIPSMFVRDLIRRGVWIDRLGFMQRVEKIRSCAGMGLSSAHATLSMLWPSKYVQGRAFPSTLRSPTFKVEWFNEGSVLLSCVELSQDRQSIFELYVWRGCDHEHKGEKRGNCYHVYTCAKCGDRYEIDSGD